ncbi:MAG: nickel-responsive transcriptional regulator NikR [Pseudomonadota bacterium]
MERFTISLDDELARDFDAFIAARGYGNRSEAVRDLIRARLELEVGEQGTGHCVASLSFVYNHHERELAERLAEHQHAHHDLTVASLHVHLDHENCLESVILQGPVGAVRTLAGQLTAEPGVRHGALNLVSVERGNHHTHAPYVAGHEPHVHLKPRY